MENVKIWCGRDYDGWRFGHYLTDGGRTNPTWLQLKSLWHQHFQSQSDCLILLNKISRERLILQRFFNNDLRWQNIYWEANYFCVNLLATYLVLAHSFTKIWRSFMSLNFKQIHPVIKDDHWCLSWIHFPDLNPNFDDII